ncbi:uncharacterized protein LOC129612069 [Condylostylus longicornis]|uniref:uncharacterized protein LOC129612069 n=1 Tax=Condylostylus longicornis TaxID=2530218 RepID=UPI00244DB34E|nr:uncharacterized protein LOC129612069 [Condylostylus longicornis]
MKLGWIVCISFFIACVKGEISYVSQNSLQPVTVFDPIRNIVEDAVKYTKELLEYISSKEKEILRKAKTVADSKFKESLKKIFDLIRKIKDLSKIGIVADVCVQRYSKQIEEIRDQINSEIEKCSDLFKEGMIPVEREIWQTYMLLYKIIREMYDVVETCIFENGNNKIKQTMCVIKKINFFKDQVNEACKLVLSSLERLEEILSKVLQDYAQCIANVEMNSLRNLRDIMYNIKNCIKENVN